MAAPNPSVSVFHFTQRVSSAKIRKYKLATERGMGGGTSQTAIPAVRDASPTPSSSIMERPAKRPKLKLSVRAPNESPDTIAVSRSRRESSLKIRYSENMIIDAADVDDLAVEQKPKPSPAASSELSSLTSLNSVEKEPTPSKAAAAPSKPRDYSRDFMSYYVADGDDEQTEDEVVEVRPPPPKAAPPPKEIRQPMQQPRPAYIEHRAQPPSYPIPVMPPPRPAMPQPTVHLIDTTRRAGKPEKPDTVAVMIKKLDALTAALTSFGGPSLVPDLPFGEDKAVAQPQQSVEKKDVDTFLEMFDDDDDSEEKTEASDKATGEFDYRLERPGEPDTPLVYGIHFIQNALRSWAQQRLASQYANHYMQWHQRAHEAAQPQKRGPGRPRRFGDEDHYATSAPPLNIQFDLARTPEGVAIAAFQDVLDCGCLQINTNLPRPLTRALSLMYMQIDHLINQGAKNESEWQCMSYGAQIEAQRVRVEKWTEAQARAQEEMARQQQLAHQQIIRQMGILPTHRSQLTAEQAQKQHAIDLERKRSLQHAAQQPHLTKYLTNPLKLDVKPPAPRVPTKLTPVVQSAGPNSTSAASAAANASSSLPKSTNIHSGPPVDGKVPNIEQLRMMPNLFSRSGQSMKFSFAPTSELALKAFGAQAFPTAHTGPNLPNRGPMSANPHFINSHASIMTNGVPQRPTPSGSMTNGPMPTNAGIPGVKGQEPQGNVPSIPSSTVVNRTGGDQASRGAASSPDPVSTTATPGQEEKGSALAYQSEIAVNQ